MDEQLVAKCLLVLGVFCAQNNIGGMGKNEILRATGSKDKPVIFETINFLKEARILGFKRVKQGKKTFVTLTPLGKEIVYLITDIKKSKDRYLAVEDKISEYIRLTEDEIHTNKRVMEKLLQKGWKQEELLSFEDVIMYTESFREKLLQKGWKQEELSSFRDVILSLFRIRDMYRKNIYSSLIYRYYTISNFEVNKNAKAVLIKIIVSAITDFLANERTLNMTQAQFSDHHHGFGNLSQPILEDIKKVYKPDKLVPSDIKIISNRFTSEEIAGLMSSLVCILKPARKDFAFTRVESEIERMKKDIKSFEKDRGVRDEDSRRYLNNLEDLARLRENCLTRYGDHLAETDEVLEKMSSGQVL